MKIQRYGWKKDKLDHRDKAYKFVPPVTALPSMVDLRPVCPPIFDQGQLGSCTANAIAAALMFEMLKDKNLPAFTPSRLFIYMNERIMEGDPFQDSGAEIRDGIKSVASQGVCSEDEWPYDISKFAVKPTDQCYLDAQTFNAFTNKTIIYQAVEHDLNHIKGALASGYPVIFGMSVFSAFESPEVEVSGIVPMPAYNEGPLGGHAVLCNGYDDHTQLFQVQNSWSQAWGIGGDFYLPYAYMADQNLTDDHWLIKLNEGV